MIKIQHKLSKILSKFPKIQFKLSKIKLGLLNLYRENCCHPTSTACTNCAPWWSTWQNIWRNTRFPWFTRISTVWRYFCILYYYENIKGKYKTILNIKRVDQKIQLSKENLILQHQSTSKDYLFVEHVSSSENSSQKLSDVDVSDVESLQDLHDPDQDGYISDTIAENKNFYK